MSHTGNTGQQLHPEQYPALIAALGDTPELVGPTHFLAHGLASAWVAGDPACFQAVAIQLHPFPAWWGFGRDATELWNLLRGLPGWHSIAVSQSVAPTLGPLMEAEMGKRVRYKHDPYYTLMQPVVPIRHPAVRQLTITDLPLLQAAPEGLRGSGWPSPDQMLREGMAAGAVIDGRLVAMVHTAARTRRYADLSAETLAEWRGRSFATAAASIVAHRVQEAGQTPVWSAAEDNWASQRVAQKLGFVEAARLTCLSLGDEP